MDKLLKVEFFKEVIYIAWLANMVLMKKTNENWQICINFTNLNNACPKDSYTLSQIDQLVNTTLNDELLTFINDFSDYNQIRMASKDEKKITFITD